MSVLLFTSVEAAEDLIQKKGKAGIWEPIKANIPQAIHILELARQGGIRHVLFYRGVGADESAMPATFIETAIFSLEMHQIASGESELNP